MATNYDWELPLSRQQKIQLDKSIIDYVTWNYKVLGQQDPIGETAHQQDLVVRGLKLLFTKQGDEGVEEGVEENNDDAIREDELLLPKKWNSIVRLQRRIVDMEKTQKELNSHIIYLNKVFKEYKENNHGNSVTSLASRDWLPSDSPFGTIMLDSMVTAIKLHPYLSMVFIGTDYGKLYAYDIFTMDLPVAVIQSHTKSITSIDVLKVHDPVTDTDSLLIAVVSKDLVLKIYNFKNNNSFVLVRSMKSHSHIISDVKIWLNENNNIIEYNNKILIATCSRDKTVKIWDYENSFVINTLELHSDWIRALDILGDYLLTGSQDTTLRFTHWPTNTGLSIGEGHTFPIESVKFIPIVGKEINAVIEEEDKNSPSSQTLMEIDEEYKTMLGFKYCVSASRDKTIKIWQIPIPKFIGNNKNKPLVNNMSSNFKCILTLVGHESWVKDLKIRGRYLFSCSDDSTIRCWDLHTGKCLKVLKDVHNAFITCIDVDPLSDNKSDSLDRELMVSGAVDSTCNILLK
ncbi:hypothetical protein TPHA_0G00720 [Tetrapisispora phaffii CBS 4417]|uniref:Uncharacterized protein n=1 Tax=Tetrapisispora phaffii (strain ATCC 24235 / CBS 4417 / NBRC 1672 / NRRL Y-8282 / UCD 70-5) TaxID=1071381 RepID=G8BVI0_TETPH|nr:hypothetical protein TPHA_0G00720 [Tetrapisispora phaffii CBS 4417]CCE63908.1 hypothetical protein TPHA_0G00720 [Tetrapisispora phaffii CBS 4417]